MKEKDKIPMPDLPFPSDEAIKLNKDYVLVDVSPFTSEVQGFNGYRVVLDGGSDDLIAIALWSREVVGRSSKLGSFLVALGRDQEEWTGKIIQFVAWQPKDRLIRVV